MDFIHIVVMVEHINRNPAHKGRALHLKKFLVHYALSTSAL